MGFFRGLSAVVAATVCLMVVSAAPALAGNVSFVERVIATNNGGVRSVSAADVDGDGDLDFLSASAGDHTVRWYENLGGTPLSFSENVLTTTRSRSNFILGADINGDQRMDIVSSSNVDDTIAWYENDGAVVPTFTERIVTEDPNGSGTLPSGFNDGVRQVLAADLDGDGDLDLAGVSVNDDRVAWYENLGGPVPDWTPRIVTGGLDGARAIGSADLDGDGDVDLFAGGWYDDRLLWFENDGAVDPVFTERTMVTFDNAPGTIPGPNPGEDEIGQFWRLLAADLDGDGDQDVLGARRLFGVEWYENDGLADPSFTRRVVSPDAFVIKSVYAADVDGDGDLDPMSASAGDDKIAWYENPGGGDPPNFSENILTEDPDGPFDKTLEGSADGARTVFAADLDGDGDTDILWGSKYNDTIGWYENQLAFLMLGDMDGDENVDFDDIDDFVLALNNPQDYENQFGVPPEAHGDMNGDGRFDFDDIAGFVAIVNAPLTNEVQSVPEPSGYVLCATALLGFLGCGWHARKRRSSAPDRPMTPPALSDVFTIAIALQAFRPSISRPKQPRRSPLADKPRTGIRRI